MYEHNALGYRSGLALCLTKVRSSRARCPATALIVYGTSNSLTRFNKAYLLLSKHSTIFFTGFRYGWSGMTRLAFDIQIKKYFVSSQLCLYPSSFICLS